MTESSAETAPAITELSKAQRRVIGVLLEKAFTTPDAYPLTLKAVTTGCNQKSNRDPVTNYSEDDVQQVLDELREMGLVGELHTEGGRTERYRHYMRQRFALSEPQLAILTELLLRGRQQLGELRTRAGRMVPIDSQDALRAELAGLQEMNLIQASAPLERRGAEVDHNVYRAGEGKALKQSQDSDEPDSDRPAPGNDRSRLPDDRGGQSSLAMTEQLRHDHGDVHRRVDALEEQLRQLAERVDGICRDLGVNG